MYRIATNRLDLTTGEIIMLYAYRWQIELFFRSIKRTFHALHLWSHSERGIETQFYLYMIVYLLLLHFKQSLIQEHNQEQAGNLKQLEEISSHKNQRLNSEKTI
ncbi:MAG: transposase [Methylococcaceae bacterium]|nr:transposase [Methylococcaceae bacterium]